MVDTESTTGKKQTALLECSGTASQSFDRPPLDGEGHPRLLSLNLGSGTGIPQLMAEVMPGRFPVSGPQKIATSNCLSLPLEIQSPCCHGEATYRHGDGRHPCRPREPAVPAVRPPARGQLGPEEQRRALPSKSCPDCSFTRKTTAVTGSR